MVTIKDVAKKSGFSVTTVSMVLNDAPLARYIPLRTKDHVKRIAEKLEYRPNLYARSLRSRRSLTVGVLVPDITDPYCNQILRGIENSLYKSAYLQILIDIQNDRDRFKRSVAMLLERRVEGLITLANSMLLETDLLEVFANRNIPMVMIGRDGKSKTMNSVVIDNEAGTRAGLEHLYHLGHRRIAFVKGPEMLVDSSQRWQGVKAFAREAGLRLDAKLTVEIKEACSSPESGYEAAKELVARRRDFTALMAFDDMTAFGAIRALNHAGLRTPADCSVMGFDDIAASAFYNPPLTTIRQPMEMLGSLGVEILGEAVQKSHAKEPVVCSRRVIKPELVVRESTAPPPPELCG